MSRPPSQEVSETALNRARELANGLYPHQVEGVAFLLARRRSILADDMGLGKTRQSIVAMVEAEPEGPWLVVCPASVKNNWQREIELVIPNPPEIVVVNRKVAVPDESFKGWVILNYDIVKKNAESLKAIPFAGFVFDEAHYLKNHKSQRSRATRALVDESNTPVVHCLTGTPMVNRPRDLFPLLQLVGHSLGKSFLGFAKRYCDAVKGEYGWETKGASNLDELTVQLHGTMLRRTKEEVLDLPGKMRTWLNVDVPASANRGMRRILATLLKETSDHVTDAADGGNDADGGTRLPPISRSKLLARLTPVRSDVAGAKMHHSIEFAKGIMDQGEKVILFSCFQEVIETMLDDFDEGTYRWFTGGTAAAGRQQAVDDFQNDDNVRILLATVIAGGVGITLTAASHVIFNDLDWVPANHWQAEDRAYRIGQKQSVNVYYFKAAGTIDEFVGQVLETKAHLISTVVDGGALQPEATEDVFDELTRTLGALDIDGAKRLTNKQIDAALDQAVATYAAEATTTIARADSDPLHKPRKARVETIRALARALSPPPTNNTKYRIKATDQLKWYELEVDGSDVLCSCRGFEFRGQCKHARTLKGALANNESVPEEYRLIEGDMRYEI